MKAVWAVARPILHRLNPERAHDLTLRALAALPLPAAAASDDPRLAVDAFGLRFANPIGLAAGFDKNGTVSHKAAALGFGFTEVGTLTPLPQPGNAKPRLFRLAEHGAVINRFGFNNAGHAVALAGPTPRNRRRSAQHRANKEAVDRVADYVAGIRAFAAVAAYFTINVSRPTRRACATCRSPRRSTSCSPACSTHVTLPRRARRSCSRSRRT